MFEGLMQNVQVFNALTICTKITIYYDHKKDDFIFTLVETYPTFLDINRTIYDFLKSTKYTVILFLHLENFILLATSKIQSEIRPI